LRREEGAFLFHHNTFISASFFLRAYRVRGLRHSGPYHCPVEYIGEFFYDARNAIYGMVDDWMFILVGEQLRLGHCPP